MSDVFLPIIAGLNKSTARYVIVGGIATVLSGYVRVTGVLDLVVDLEPSNCTKLLGALAKLDYSPIIPVALWDFADAKKRSSWVSEKGMQVFGLASPRFPLVAVDLFAVEPVPFEELWSQSVAKMVDNVEFRICGIQHLIMMKRQAGRPKDLLDITNLESILRDQK